LDVQDNYIFTGMDSVFTILDISDIYNVAKIYSDTLKNIIESVFVKDDYVYLGLNDGLLILNISQVNDPRIISKLETKEYIVRVFVSGTLAFLGTQDYAFLIIDISDPQHPFETGRVDQDIDDVWGFDIKGDTLFVASEDTGVRIFDISSPSQPDEISSITLQNNVTVLNVRIQDNVAWVLQPGTLYSFDISDLDSIRELDQLEDAGGQSLFIDGNYAYTGSAVTDISDPADLKMAGSYPLHGYDTFVRDNIIFIPVQNKGIYFVRFDPLTGIFQENRQPQAFRLYQNYPNPFNPNTVINYQLSMNSQVILSVYDVLGREVKTFVDKYQVAGEYSVKFDASGLTSGVYYYKLKTEGLERCKKMLLLR